MYDENLEYFTKLFKQEMERNEKMKNLYESTYDENL